MSKPSHPDAELAWAAGLFEGEGCMNDYPRGGKRGIQMRLGSTDQDVVERFATIVGAGNVKGPYERGPDHWKPIYEWSLYEAARIAEVIERLLPWFGKRRTKRALEMAAVAESIGLHKGKRTHCPKGHPYEGENLLLERGTRRCRTCRRRQERDRARKRLGITPDRYRKKE